MAEVSSLLSQQDGGVLTLTLARRKANAFDETLILELADALRRAGKDDVVRCVILTGAGHVFSAGQDISILAGEERILVREGLERTYNRLVRQMRALEKPILGAINGPAAGAGLGVALATDIRIAARSARFVFGFGGIGLTADSGISLTLPVLIGLGRASEMAYTNEPLSAEQALDYGLVNRVVDDADLPGEARAMAERIAAGAPRAHALTKRAFQRAVLGGLDAALDYEVYLQEAAAKTEDHREGVRAFLEKRPPLFRGR